MNSINVTYFYNNGMFKTNLYEIKASK